MVSLPMGRAITPRQHLLAHLGCVGSVVQADRPHGAVTADLGHRALGAELVQVPAKPLPDHQRPRQQLLAPGDLDGRQSGCAAG